MTAQHPMLTAQKALSALAEFSLKREDAPCSAEAHFDKAILILSEMSLEWQPTDPEIIKVIQDSREHMAHFYDIAKEPWPRKPTKYHDM